MPHHASNERHALAKTLRLAGPDAPTLCGDWNTAQLAAHLVLRERSVVELAGRFRSASLQRRAAAIVDAEAGRPYGSLVDQVEAGPSWRDVRGPVPVAWLWSVPAVREQANLLEYLIHHEDVRRAGDTFSPRSLGVDVQMAVWKKLDTMAKLLLRKVPIGVALVWPSHGEIHTKAAEPDGPAVTIAADPIELAMMAFGRIPQAQLDWTGAAEDIAAVRGADISL